MRKLTKEWLKAANDDLILLNDIKNNEHITNLIAFHSQQAIEKLLKSLIEEYEIDIPKIHKLIKLKNILIDKITINNDELLNKLDNLYIDSRYPGDMGLLPYGKPTLNDAKEFYDFALMVFDKVCSILKLDKTEFVNNA